MSFQPTRRPAALALLALGATVAGAQYSTPVGSGAAKPKTLRATAVLEWTGSLEKPNASRLMPVAVWDGEHYQPAGLYLARPDPLALETGTQYELERSGEPVGLFNVRAAADLHGEWVGVGRFQAEAPPPPPPKLKVSKHLPALSNGKPASTEKSAGSETPSNADGRPTLHRKTDESAPAPSGSAPSPAGSTPAGGSNTSAGPQPSADKTDSSKPADTSSTSSSGDADHPTLHRRTDSSDTSSASTGPAATTGTPPASGSGSASSPSTSSSSSTDPDGPTLHRRSDTADTKSPDVDSDRPTLHKHDDSAKGTDVDPDRPTLHRARSGADTSGTIDPDRPRLRYGGPAEASQAALPTRLVGVPPSMQQIVAVSDSATGDPRPYQFHWASPDDAAQMQAALAALAAQAVVKPTLPTAKPTAQFGPTSHTAATRRTHQAKSTAPAAGPALVDEHFTAYELSFSGGATLVYSAHTADEGPKRIYVTLIAQPDFSGKPQVLLQQVARGDRLDEVPAMQLVDAVDTDNDQRAELIFQLTGAAQPPASAELSQAAKDLAANTSTDQATQFARDAAASAAATANANAAAIPERAFAIYRVANGKALQVFNTGPLP